MQDPVTWDCAARAGAKVQEVAVGPLQVIIGVGTSLPWSTVPPWPPSQGPKELAYRDWGAQLLPTPIGQWQLDKLPRVSGS